MPPLKSISVAGLAIGIGLVILGAIIGFDVATMRMPPTYAKVGPQVFPAIICAGLILTGAVIVWRSCLPVARRPLVAEDAGTDWRALAIISAGLVAHFLLLKPLGFVVMAFALFMVVVVALGSRRYLRDGLIGAILALVTFVGFTRGLGLQLPNGILAGLF